ncbi:hypothetical protein yberc0001_31230 [Yersinia bercovieri ATCC 43970]|uniref:Uncharacterized protein n=1 Tax=Yersinia bercovieri ATCC 43970 TaxID=349968 RepID=A0ABM9XY16_YERBE|nr:hypothetical protein yberc0001_31230 [Yersinia bercovieri ATCC 43970]
MKPLTQLDSLLKLLLRISAIINKFINFNELVTQFNFKNIN